ncbi:methionyl-tRNA formyltransferase [Chelatococcus reniformis]|uniref:Methionyl-tRNA formyltransferase n=1 Tax=Chelatococcus reniformis TaxID=1494448 RepID=A0A916UN28_9HYPH|nr:methionyl-tRNA formyltransferase [Chelatococcus reniformis]GGC79971.1 methionyl-tRNA formyltransferase [Chelatococcus reniformis]
MRIIFMGTPDFAVPALAELVGHGHELCAVYTRAPRPAGRGMGERKTPVHALAERFGLPVLTPKTLRTPEAAAAFRAHGADLAVVVAYGLILPPEILAAPAHGCFNLHASLLPRWRGAAPIQRAVMAGDTESGVCVMRMEEGLDTGPVGMAERVPVGPDMTAGELHDRLAPLGADLMARAVAALSRDALGFTPQPDTGVTYAHKIANDDARLDWTVPAAAVHNRVRGLSPFPGSFFEADLGRGQPERVKVLRTALADGTGAPGTLLGADFTVACGSGAVRLLLVQRAGKGVVPGDEFLRGARLALGATLS